MRSCEKTVGDNGKQSIRFGFKGENALTRVNDCNFFSWITQNTYLSAACVKTVINKKTRSMRKGIEVINEKKLSTTSGLVCLQP